MEHRRVSYVPPDRPLSRAHWVDQRCRQALEIAVPELLLRLQHLTPHMVFLGGSACLAEAVGWCEGTNFGPILSDLDLGVVTERRAAAGARGPLLGALRAILPADGPEITLGFYTLGDVARQAPTPGLLDIRLSGICLAGEADLLHRFLGPGAAGLPRYEALRLIGNRALELLSAAADAPPRRLYALSKASLGVWTSWLILKGRYVPGLGARIEMLETEAAAGAPPSVLRGAALFRRFALDPRPDHAPAAEDGAEVYRLALAEFLHHSGGPDLPELELLREPFSLRDRYRLWRHGLVGGPGRRGRALLLLARQALMGGDPIGTPENRRLAAACLACRLGGYGQDREWVDGAARLLFSVPERGPDLAKKIAELP